MSSTVFNNSACLNKVMNLSGPEPATRPSAAIPDREISFGAKSDAASLRPIEQQIDQVLAEELKLRGVSKKNSKTARFNIKLIANELIIDGMKHGNGYDATKLTNVDFKISRPEGLLARIELTVKNQGGGFDPRGVPDPRMLENIEKLSGRGVLLILGYSTAVEYSDSGRCCRATLDIRPRKLGGVQANIDSERLFVTIDGQRYEMWPKPDPASITGQTLAAGAGDAIVRAERSML